MTDQLYHDPHLAQFYDLDNSRGKDSAGEAPERAGLETAPLCGSRDITSYTPQSEKMIFEVRHKTNI
ncbi:hypothetical protein [Chitinophaga varians]|uniref:hypothetical protein n=1 Tax=Chitinophaga varians TaxID=2202339 RepID=UPI00165FF01B|nr:hypothetical protein [Chitinophaga varians]MBC9909184.1 hypothetical protein [Chitinophaga varians]